MDIRRTACCPCWPGHPVQDPPLPGDSHEPRVFWIERVALGWVGLLPDSPKAAASLSKEGSRLAPH